MMCSFLDTPFISVMSSSDHYTFHVVIDPTTYNYKGHIFSIITDCSLFHAICPLVPESGSAHSAQRRCSGLFVPCYLLSVQCYLTFSSPFFCQVFSSYETIAESPIT
jgi:hypothetical protein